MSLYTSLYIETMKLKKTLENNIIEVIECKNYNLTQQPLTISAGGNFSTDKLVKKKIFLKTKINQNKHSRIEKLKTLNIVDFLEHIKQLDNLIRSKNTRELSILSQEFGISQRQILIQLEILKCLNAKIKFSKKLNSFYYTEPFELLFQFSILSITNEDIAEIYCSSEEKPLINFKKISDIL